MENTIEVQKCKKGATYFLTGAWYECYNKQVKFKGQDKDDKFYVFVDDKKNEYSAMKSEVVFVTDNEVFKTPKWKDWVSEYSYLSWEEFRDNYTKCITCGNYTENINPCICYAR